MTISRSLVPSRTVSRRNPLGRYTPQSITPLSRWKFIRDRRANLIRSVGGEPDDHQARIIGQMIDLEWQAVKLEAEADAAQTGKERYGRLKLAADYRRQLLLFDRELARVTKERQRAAVAKAEASPSYREHLAQRGAGS